MTANSTSPGQIARAPKRGGPRSAAGKAIASRNALRHGFSAALHRRPPAPEQIERLVRAICADDRDPAVVALAYKIAETQLLLSDVAMQKIAIVERLREPYANAFSRKDNSLQLATARALQAWLEHREIVAQIPALLKKYELRLTVETLSDRRKEYAAFLERKLPVLFPDANEPAAIIEEWMRNWLETNTARLKAQGWRTESDDIVPVRLKALLEEPENFEAPGRRDRQRGAPSLCESEQRDEYEAVEAAALDLVRLERYQHRAWSRQKRAILELAKVKLTRRYATKRRSERTPEGAL